MAINKVIKVFIFSDFCFVAAWGLVAPILAVFVVKNIQGGDVGVVGIGAGIYWLLKSVLQVPIGRYLDRNHGEKDDYYFLILGLTIASLVPLGFIFAKVPLHIYLLQAIYSLGMAMAIPPWGGIFTRHIDKGKEAFSWGLESSAIGIGAGITGIAGGIIAKIFGFVPLFAGVSILGLISVAVLLLIRKDLLPKGKTIVIPKP